MKEKTKSNLGVTFIIFVVVLLGLALLAGTRDLEAEEKLEGNIWVAMSINGEDTLPGVVVSAEFKADGVVSGSAGCNSYSTTYELKGDKITFSDEVATTRRFCEEFVNEQETEFLAALAEVRTFKIKNNELTLYDNDDNELVVFEVEKQDLTNTEWDVTSYNNQKGGITTLIKDTQMDIYFGEDGQLTGNSGCNTYSGTYEVNGDEIKIGPLASTFMACPEPEGIMEQEIAYLTALESATTFRVEGNLLMLRTADDQIAVEFQLIEE